MKNFLMKINQYEIISKDQFIKNMSFIANSNLTFNDDENILKDFCS